MSCEDKAGLWSSKSILKMNRGAPTINSQVNDWAVKLINLGSLGHE